MQAGGRSNFNNICACYSGYLSCIVSKPRLANCAGFDASKKSFIDACNVLKCKTCAASAASPSGGSKATAEPASSSSRASLFLLDLFL